MEPKYSLKDADGNVVLKIEGPMCTFSICGSDVEFNVLTLDGLTEVGKISKQTDVFGINFPMDLDVRCKATLIGAAFLIDYMFFEKKSNDESDGFGMAS